MTRHSRDLRSVLLAAALAALLAGGGAAPQVSPEGEFVLDVPAGGVVELVAEVFPVAGSPETTLGAGDGSAPSSGSGPHAALRPAWTRGAGAAPPGNIAQWAGLSPLALGHPATPPPSAV